MKNTPLVLSAGIICAFFAASPMNATAQLSPLKLPLSDQIRKAGSNIVKFGHERFLVTYKVFIITYREFAQNPGERNQWLEIRKMEPDESAKQTLKRQTAPAYTGIHYSWRSDRPNTAMVQNHRLFEWNKRIYIEILTELEGERTLSYFRYNDRTDVFHWFDHTDQALPEYEPFNTQVLEPRLEELEASLPNQSR